MTVKLPPFALASWAPLAAAYRRYWPPPTPESESNSPGVYEPPLLFPLTERADPMDGVRLMIEAHVPVAQDRARAEER